MLKKTIREYYLLSALFNLGLSTITAMYVIFLLSHGLNLLEVNLVNLVFFTTMVLCEIPTGTVADTFGRKTSFLLACALLGIGMLVYASSQTFLAFAVAEEISAIGHTFASGAFRSWFVDKMLHYGHTGEFDKIFARVDTIGRFSGLGAALLGTFLYTISAGLPWIVGGLFFFLTGIVALFIKEEYFVKQRFSVKSGLGQMLQIAKTSFRLGLKDRNIRFLFLLMTIQIFALQAPNMQWQPFFEAKFGDATYLGLVWAGISISVMIGAFLASRISGRFRDKRKILLLVQMFIGGTLVITAMLGILPAIVLVFLMHEMARGVFGPISSAYLHEHIPSQERATMESFQSLAHHFGGAVGLLASGFVANLAGINSAWTIFGTVLVVIAFLIMRNGKEVKIEIGR